MRNRLHQIILYVSWALCSSVFANPTSCLNNRVFNIGTGIYDITGPAAEEGMMGYAMIQQQTAGIYQRLWARAFIVESPCNGKRIVFVNADLGQVFQGIREGVIVKLKKKYGELYGDDNVLITATHTHSGPGGYSTYTLYNLTTLGFNRDNFDVIINGIVSAIDRAHHHLQPGEIKIAQGDLPEINHNRSPTAYLLNPLQERLRYAGDTDTEMTLLRFDSTSNKPLGILNWYPIHGVSMNNKNHLITGDNKGYAEYLFERDFHSDYDEQAFVAAFAQANAGDVSPNLYGHEGKVGLEGLNAIAKAGRPQYQKAKELFNRASQPIMGEVDYRHTFVALDQVTIELQFSEGLYRRTCPAAIGVSMLAGTQDGEGIGKQGVTCDTVTSLIPHFICENRMTECQGVKPIALEMGTIRPYPWTPNILPLQILKMGNVIIIAAPFELTTMTGRRIREAVQAEFPRSEHYTVVLSTLANAYSGYVATPEEYQLQRYEGASTHFGPFTQMALLQEFVKLAKALREGTSVPSGPEPLDLSQKQVNLQPGVLFDLAPLFKSFGDVYQDVHALYKPGETAQVVFWGGHPKNNFRTQDTFLEVQKRDQGKWLTIRRDRDWDTEYRWQRSGLASSLITIDWRIPKDIEPGEYRILHKGDRKDFWNGKIYPYTGFSSVFKIK